MRSKNCFVVIELVEIFRNGKFLSFFAMKRDIRENCIYIYIVIFF